MKPIELLNKELKDLERSLEKSENSYKNGSITFYTNRIHKMNLEPLIKEYKRDINKLL